MADMLRTPSTDPVTNQQEKSSPQIEPTHLESGDHPSELGDIQQDTSYSQIQTELSSPANEQSFQPEVPQEEAEVAEASRQPATELLPDTFETQSAESSALRVSEVKNILKTIASSSELEKDFIKLIAQSPELVKHLDMKQLTTAMIEHPSRHLKEFISQRVPLLINQEVRKRVTESSKSTQIATPELRIGVLSQEVFKANTTSLQENPHRSGHLIASPPSRTLCVVEVVLKASTSSESQMQRRRHIDHRKSTAATPDIPLQDVPEKVRLRSTFLLDLLHRVTNERLNHGGEKTPDKSRSSLVFLYPFKFFVIHADSIEAEANRLEAKFGNGGQSEQSNVAKSPHGPGADNGSAISRQDAVTDMETDLEDVFESRRAYEHLKLVKELLFTHLKPIIELRKSYRSGTRKTVSFQDLWLLYEVGGLVFQREPSPNYPPSISRVTYFDGGRELLNNGEFKGAEPRKDIPGKDSKGAENRFYLRYYRLDFDGEDYGPVEDGFSIPPWEGTRSVYSLKAFPLCFCRDTIDHAFGSIDDFQEHVIQRGKKFVELDPISHKHYDGQVIGSKHEFYNSPVVVDFKMRTGDKEPRHGLLALMEYVLKSESSLSAGLTFFPGDPREVQEGNPRANSSTECIIPGCDGNEFIHDDIRSDQAFARQQIPNYGITSSKFSRNDIGDLAELDYALFPTFVYGYVLNDRVWAKLDLDVLTGISTTGSMFDALHIPEPQKQSIKVLTDMCKSRISRRLALDVVPGKGRGIIILLHGKPGLGKTATAEAMAADLGRPLYPITYADLGDGPSEIETNLKKIFRYGQRWNCVLLLDEADVFLMPRNIEDTKRNSIVSIFLRNLEWYPGIIFLTSNRLDRFDKGVLDRVHLVLRYPDLSETFTKEIFSDHFERINRLSKQAENVTSGEYRPPASYCQVKQNDGKEIQEWVKAQYTTARKADTYWWNGRQIRNAFQLATGFAEQETNANQKEIASIKVRHFEKVLELNETFKVDMNNALNEDHDEAGQ